VPRRLLHLRPWRRHSIVLAVAGVVYICYGTAILAVPPNDARISNLRMATEIMPIRVWGFVWIIVGLGALASTRWPPQSETWGYAAMSGLAAFWAAIVAFGIFFLDAPFQGITGALVWAMVAFMWWGISGLMNPDDEVPHKPVGFDWSIYAPTHREPHRPLADPASTAEPISEE
jgi:hypothetical protein